MNRKTMKNILVNLTHKKEMLTNKDLNYFHFDEGGFLTSSRSVSDQTCYYSSQL